MERTSLEAGTRGSGRCQMTDGGGVMISPIHVKAKSGDSGCFMKLQVCWGGCRCDGPDHDDSVRQLLGIPPESPLESLHFVWKIEFEIEFLLDHLNWLSSGTADGFRCSIEKRGKGSCKAGGRVISTSG